MLGHKRIDHIRNTDILRTIKQQPLSNTIKERQLRWLGHILRKDEATLVNRFSLYAPQIGKRKPGRPKTTYTKYILSLTAMSTVHDVTEKVLDRDECRKMVVDRATVVP